MKGGVRQRFGKLAARPMEPEGFRSAKLYGSVAEWCWGKSSAPDLLKRFLHDRDDVAALKQILPADMASVTNSKTKAAALHNAHRIIMKYVKTHFSDWTGMVRHVNGPQIQKFLPPTAFLGKLCSNYPEKARMMLGYWPDTIRQFWTGLYSSRQGRLMWRGHTFLRGKRPEDLLNCLPAVIHEDAGPASKQLSPTILNISSVLAMGGELDIKIVIAVYDKITGPEGKVATDDLSWAAILEDLEVLASGHWPLGPWAPGTERHRQAGKPVMVLDDTAIGLIPLWGKQMANMRPLGGISDLTTPGMMFATSATPTVRRGHSHDSHRNASLTLRRLKYFRGSRNQCIL